MPGNVVYFSVPKQFGGVAKFEEILSNMSLFAPYGRSE
jgi:hypothetical protein